MAPSPKVARIFSRLKLSGKHWAILAVIRIWLIAFRQEADPALSWNNDFVALTATLRLLVAYFKSKPAPI